MKKLLTILLTAILINSCKTQDYCTMTKGFVQSGSGFHQDAPKMRFK
jgi:hypothetical protein